MGKVCMVLKNMIGYDDKSCSPWVDMGVRTVDKGVNTVGFVEVHHHHYYRPPDTQQQWYYVYPVKPPQQDIREEDQCSVATCTNAAGQRRSRSLRFVHAVKPDPTGCYYICDSCYFSDRYKWKRKLSK